VLDKVEEQRRAYQGRIFDVLAEADVQQLRLRMEEARARRLQPHYVQAFFTEAFRGSGGG
jgi:hypothetical protein